MDIRAKNFSLFSSIDPLGAVRVSQAKTDHLKWVKTDCGEDNLEGAFFYHSPQGALKEAQNLFHSLSLKKCQVIYLYGIGLGYFYEASKEWLKEDLERSLVFLEDDPSVVNCLFSLERAGEILKDPQVMLWMIDKKELQEDIQLFRMLTWAHLLKIHCITALSAYVQYRLDDYRLIKDRLLQESSNKNDLVSEYLSSSIPFYRNYFPNLFKLPDSLMGSSLFGEFQNVPALICGAGPSLNKQLDQLNDLKERACLFAGGTAMKLLTQAGVRPHFGGGIDPNTEQWKLYQQIKELDFPVFYHPRIRCEALDLVKGPKLYLSGTGGYEIGKWVDEQLGIATQEMDEGHNVIHFLTQIALRMGCNPIIFIGMDLSSATALHGVLRNDIYGNPVHTEWKWIRESQWTSTLAKERNDCRWINATEGGIGFKGIENRALKEVHLEKIDVDKKIKAALKKAQMPKEVTYERIEELLETLRLSLERCMGFLGDLKNDSEEMRLGGRKSLEGLSGRGMLAYHDLIEEVAYPVILEVYERIQKLLAGEKALQKQPEIWGAVLQAAQDIHACLIQTR